MLSELNINIICANSPQAKGRVERAFWYIAGSASEGAAPRRHLDDRSSERLGAAFMVDYNARFGRAPENAKDLHRKLTKSDDLSEFLAWREERTVTKNLTLHDA